MRKTENFVTRKCYPKKYEKVKERKLNSENLVTSLKSLVGF